MPAETDVVARLADLPGVAQAAAQARAEVDALLWERRLSERKPRLQAESALRGARASAALDGADVSLAAVRSGAALDGSPIGRVVAATLRLNAELPGLAPVWGRAPLQALARLHAVTAAGFSPDDELGRPRQTSTVDDPLRLGAAPPPGEVAVRLDALAELVTSPTAAPAVVLAALAHAELMALRPFGWGSGLIARAAGRLVLASRGVDPDLLTIPEEALYVSGRPGYVQALRGYLSGSQAGVAGWLILGVAAVGAGAVEARTVLAELPD